MAPFSLLVLSSAISLLIVVITFNNGRKRRSIKLPPGSQGWPLIGEVFSLSKPRPVTTLGDFLEQRISRYGKIFSTNLFGKQIIVSTDVELNRFITQNDTKLFEHGWPQHFVKMIGESVPVFTTGDVHKFQRSTILNFFGGARLGSFVHEVEQLAAMTTNSWEDNSVIYAKDEAGKFVFNVMTKKLMSMVPGEPKVEILRKELETFMKGLFAFPLKFPGTAYWKALQAKTTIAKAIKQKIEERVEKKGVHHIKLEEDDFLGWIMDNTSYTSEEILDLLCGLLIGSYLTTSSTITSMIYFLGKCPKAIEQLREEYLETIRSRKQRGGSKLTWEDYKHMEFTQCIINETLRIGTGVILQKKAATDVQFKDYVIPRGHIVVAHVSAMHLDPSLYEDPENFDPWRWLGASSVKNTKFMPFGGGVRLCPGAEVARLEMIVFLHHLILNYDWKLVSPEYPVALAHVDFLQGLPIKVQALYSPYQE